ncbi:prohibitin family protein [Niameybacter massiliensis]|uniref:prohibitin family protein n=1 Tax=Niameybacter massiliensis TaxID=1658108 RepID=UPI0006B67C04|nr:prohibitin family protein [Niameybacter massiliensis]
MKARKVGASILTLLLVCAAVATFTCLEKVPAGYAGVVYSLNGGVTGEVLGQGMHFISPFEHVAEYPVSTETMYLSKDKVEGSKGDDSFNISTKDGKPVNVDVELSYRYDQDKVDEVYTKWRGKSPTEIEDTYIRARIKSVANEVTSQYGVMDVYGEKRTELNQKVYEQLSKTLVEDGIVIETFNFTRIEPDENTLLSIQQKVDAQQKLEQQKIEAEQVKIEAEKKIVEANAQAEAELIKAKANADSQIIKAEAEKKANTLVSESLDEKVLRLKELQKWNGSLPMVQSESIPIIKIGE